MKSRCEKAFKLILENQVTLIFIKDECYNECLIELLCKLSKTFKDIVYITLNRPCAKVLKDFNKNKIDSSKFCFIDVISTDIRVSEKIENCTYVSHKDLVTLSVTISEILAKRKPQLLILDSFHTMLSYENKDVVTRFAHDLIAKLDISDCKGLFPTLKADRDAVLTHDLEMFVDKVSQIG